MGIDIHFSELSTFLSRSPTFATARAIDRREPASIAGRLFAGMICEQRIHWMLDGNFALRSEAPSARPLCQPHLQPLRVVSENVVYTETKQPFPIVRSLAVHTLTGRFAARAIWTNCSSTTVQCGCSSLPGKPLSEPG